MNLQNFKHNDWITYWAGNWSILTFSYWGKLYTQKNYPGLTDRFLTKTIITWEKGGSTCFFRRTERSIFGNKLARLVAKDPNIAIKLCSDFKNKVDEMLKLMKSLCGKDISFGEYKNFQNTLIFSYYPFHTQNKILVDYLPPDILTKLLPQFERARVYAEPVFAQSEVLMSKLAEIHSKKIGYKKEQILATFDYEFEKYLQGDNLPDKKILKNRNQAAALFFENGKMTGSITGKQMSQIKDILSLSKEKSLIRGTTAFPGKVRGRVKIILDANKAKSFTEGDVLVAAMTRPEYLPFMKKSIAFVTDGGGMLCHAAITARELKKPCIVGTEIATKVLKDGDLVEVDADKGIVKIIK